MVHIPLAMTTDYLKDDDDPRPYLQKITEAGFSHIHWGHQWNSDYIYLDNEIDLVKNGLNEYHLQVYAIHGSTGREHCWYSHIENQRLAGVELVKNRIRMAGRICSPTVIMHISMGPRTEAARAKFLTRLYRSLDSLQPYAAHFGVRLALENEVQWDQLARIKTAAPVSIARKMALLEDNFSLISQVLANYGPDYLGLCYDSGHGNIGRDRTDRLAPLTERLIAVHLHDNDGSGDQHRLPFEGSVNWAEVTRIIAASPHVETLCIESQISQDAAWDEAVFLKQARQAGESLAGMVNLQPQSELRAVKF